ncbi:MAG: hypothetical protein IPJ82_17680 [Lewinellaceae bacterium]|nr:hypothetical protein [Lewinellaceae bacterium]
MLYKLFKSVSNEPDFETLLKLTFTEHERVLMLERWRIFDALDRGLSQREVSKDVPCSVVTATRGAKVFRENKEEIARFLPAWRAE